MEQLNEKNLKSFFAYIKQRDLNSGYRNIEGISCYVVFSPFGKDTAEYKELVAKAKLVGIVQEQKVPLAITVDFLRRFKINPEYEALLPKLSAEEFEALKKSIRTEGQHYKIVVNDNPPDGAILDGHQRYHACLELGQQPDFEVRKFANKLSEKLFVIESNLRRRQLNILDLVRLGVEIENIEAARAKLRQGTRTDLVEPNVTSVSNETEVSGKAMDIAAKWVNLTPTTYHRAKTVLEKGTIELQKQVRNGEKTVSAAYNEIVHAEKALSSVATESTVMEKAQVLIDEGEKIQRKTDRLLDKLLDECRVKPPEAFVKDLYGRTVDGKITVEKANDFASVWFALAYELLRREGKLDVVFEEASKRHRLDLLDLL